MIYKNLVTDFNRAWKFTRSETLEILSSLTDTQIKFKPKGPKWQPLYWEFGCIGRTQLVYTRAIETGWMDFSLFHSLEMPSKDQFKTQHELRDFLEKCDKAWIAAIRKRREQDDFKVKWPGFNQSLVVHINSLMSHERLHHGQFVSYFTLAGFELPRGFKSNWAL